MAKYPSDWNFTSEPDESVWVDVNLTLKFDGSGTDDAHGAAEIITEALNHVRERYFGEKFEVTRFEVTLA